MFVTGLCLLLGIVSRFAGGGSASGASSGLADGIGSAVLFQYPYCIALDTLGKVYVTDSSNKKIRILNSNGK